MKRGRVAIVYPWPNLDTVPSLCNAVSLLSEHGYLVDIFTVLSPDFKVPAFDSSGIYLRVPRLDTLLRGLVRTRHLERKQFRKTGALFTLLTGCYRLSKRLISHIFTLTSSAQVLRLHCQRPYQCFIGVDPAGLLQARLLARFIRAPLVYYSLELLLSNEARRPEEERLKRKEILVSRKAPVVIIQDQERAQLLAQDNQIPLKNFVLVPNAPLGPARRKPSCYWHRQFGLPPDMRIVVYAGSLGQWTGIEQIVASVRSWPEKWALVVHTRYDAEATDDVVTLRELAPLGRVFFSLKPVARQEYEALLDGADIGIAFYVPTAGSTYTNRNIHAIGFSSGKISYYLRAGLPVIVNEASSISQLVERKRCGVSVRAGQDIGRAIGQIAQDYQEYSEQACKVFDNHLDFGRGFQEVISRIDSLGREVS